MLEFLFDGRPVIDRTFPLAVPLTPSSTSRPDAPAAM